MARQTGPVFLQGTYGNICAYWCNGQWLFRQKSTLTGKRVKTSPRFRVTMQYAGLLKRSSVIASAVYAALPAHWKQFWMYRSFVGEAMRMLKEGKKDEEVLAVLWAVYVAEFDAAYREEEVFLHRWVKPTRRNVFIWHGYAARKGEAAYPRQRLNPDIEQAYRNEHLTYRKLEKSP